MNKNIFAGFFCLAILLFSSFMLLAGCEASMTPAKAADAVKKEEFVEIDTDEMVKLRTWHFTSGVPNNAIELNHADENVEFECAVDNGHFNFFAYDGRSGFDTISVNCLTAKSGDKIYWRHTLNVEQAFVTITVKAEDSIIGYAVIKIYQKNPLFHTANILKAVLIPKVDNRYQSVSEEQIKKIINKIINDNRGINLENAV